MEHKHVYHKTDYIGAPVKNVAIAHQMHGEGEGCGCGHDEHGHNHGCGLCMAVVDDANDRVYIYGNIVHENYHVPGNQCIAWTGVASAGFGAVGRIRADEFFEGEQDNNTVRLAHTPTVDGDMFVFLNGIKQREGNENDYVVNGNTLHFNFYNLLDTDLVEVIYYYGAK